MGADTCGTKHGVLTTGCQGVPDSIFLPKCPYFCISFLYLPLRHMAILVCGTNYADWSGLSTSPIIKSFEQETGNVCFLQNRNTVPHEKNILVWIVVSSHYWHSEGHYHNHSYHHSLSFKEWLIVSLSLWPWGAIFPFHLMGISTTRSFLLPEHLSTELRSVHILRHEMCYYTFIDLQDLLSLWDGGSRGPSPIGMEGCLAPPYSCHYVE